MITTPKIRNVNLLWGVALGIAVIIAFAAIFFANAPVSPAVNSPQNVAEDKSGIAILPLTADVLPEYRQSEWRSVAIPMAGANELSAYYLSERTLVDPNAGLKIFQLSERTLVDPQAGILIYLASERTSVPVRFTKYQLSEWFGK